MGLHGALHCTKLGMPQPLHALSCRYDGLLLPLFLKKLYDYHPLLPR
jgi:hypothetical protein